MEIPLKGDLLYHKQGMSDMVFDIVDQSGFYSIHDQFRAARNSKFTENIFPVCHDGVKTEKLFNTEAQRAQRKP